MATQLHITQVRSGIGRPEKQRKTLHSLGLRKIRQTVVHQDSPQIRGMIHAVQHLVEWKEVNHG